MPIPPAVALIQSVFTASFEAGAIVRADWLNLAVAVSISISSVGTAIVIAWVQRIHQRRDKAEERQYHRQQLTQRISRSALKRAQDRARGHRQLSQAGRGARLRAAARSHRARK